MDVGFGVLAHASEFEDEEKPFSEADAALLKKDGAFGDELDEQADEDHQGKPEGDGETNEEKIEVTFPIGEDRGIGGEGNLCGGRHDGGGGVSGRKWMMRRHTDGLEDERHLELATGRSEAVGGGVVIGVGVKKGG